MNPDVEYLIERLSNQAGTNQCVVSHREKCCKVKRKNYFPNEEDGRLIFIAETEWIGEGFSVSEMLEVLNMYKDNISDVLFETVNNEVCNLLNIFEVDNIGNEGEYNCLLIVGEPGETLKLYNNPDNTNYMTDTINRVF